MTRSRITISGGICGNIWQPGCGKCGMPLSADISRAKARITGGKVTLRDVIELILAEVGGDFSFAQLTGDTEICVTITLIVAGRVNSRSRYWPITAFPSIADYVDAESYSSAFNGDND